MSGLLPVKGLISVGVVVPDLEKATRRYAEILGIDSWEVRTFDADRLSVMTSRGRRVEGSFRTAVGTTKGAVRESGVAPGPDAVPVTFELVQPLAGETPFQEFRFRRTQGICHLTLSQVTSQEWPAIQSALADAGLGTAASMTVDGTHERHLIDTRSRLGGFLVEVLVGDATQSPVDEVWDHSGTYTRPERVGPLPVQGVGHFGVVVNDVIATIEQFNEVLGVEHWRIRDWRSEPDLLQNPFYRGEDVDHEYFTGLAPFTDFGFEVIEPTKGPSHYNREFRDVHGEGVHHMLLSVTADKQLWDSNREWLASIGVPLAMGAELIRGSGEFCYYDTEEALGGWLLEATCRHFPADPHLVQPHYVIDFSAMAAVV